MDFVVLRLISLWNCQRQTGSTAHLTPSWFGLVVWMWGYLPLPHYATWLQEEVAEAVCYIVL